MYTIPSVALLLNVQIILLGPFSGGSSFCVACVCNHCHRKNQNRISKMGPTSHLSHAYNAFSSYRVSFSLISNMTKMSLMMSLTIMVLDPCLLLNLVYLIRALF